MKLSNRFFTVWSSSFYPLRHINLRIYLSGQAVSLVGTWLQITAQSLLVYQLSNGSATALGIVAIASASPMLIFSLWLGMLGDRIDRRKLLIFTQVGEMLLAFILAWLVQSAQAQLWHVYVLAFLLGTFESVVFPTQQTFLSDIVGMAEIRQAISLNAMIINVSRAIGPAIAGFIVGQFGLATTFWLNGLSFLAVIVSLLVIRIVAANQVQNARQQAAASLGEALRYVIHHPQLRSIVLSMGVLNAFGISVYAIVPALVAGNAYNTGYLLGAAGAGSMCCIFFVMPFVNQVKRMGLVLSGGLIWMGVWLVVLSRSTWFPFSVFAIFLAGFATTVVWVGSLGLIQVIPPSTMRARLLGMFSIVSFGVQPIAALLLGSLADRITPASAVLASSLTMTLFAAVTLAQPAWRKWQIPLETSSSASSAEVEAGLSHTAVGVNHPEQ